jgi:hypothetical protein
MNTDDLIFLEKKIATAKDGSRALSAVMAEALGYRDILAQGGWHDERGQYTPPEEVAFTTSLDAAIALVERIRPGGDGYKGWSIDTLSRPPFTCCDVGWKFKDTDGTVWHNCGTGEHSSAPIAVCIALVKALIAQDDTEKKTINPSNPTPPRTLSLLDGRKENCEA